jgi:hypothetical protein
MEANTADSTESGDKRVILKHAGIGQRESSIKSSSPFTFPQPHRPLPCFGTAERNRSFNSTDAPFKSANALIPMSVTASANIRSSAYNEAPPAVHFDFISDVRFSSLTV